MNTIELEKLHVYLNKKNINHEYKDLYGGKQIKIIRYNKTYSFITHPYSYGGDIGLIEFYDFKNDPKGYLTADQCKRMIRYRKIT